jgi:protein O-mannosyl-transferase
LFGLNPGAHHLINALLHAVNALLLFFLLVQLTKRLWPATILAALFAWHPLRVESVAWIAERKDVLSACFGLLCLLAYVRYVKTTAGQGAPSQVRPRRSGFYWLALLFLLIGLMAKPMLVTLPLVMLLLDWWPLQRWDEPNPKARRGLALVLEKWPVFLVVVASSAVTLLAQREEAVVGLEQCPLGLRLQNATVAYASYLLKFVWPVNLAVIYPLPRTIAWLPFLTSALVVGGISALCVRWRKTKPHLLVGWLWFLITLVPVIGLVQVGGQAMADRYTYLPQIGLLLGLVWEGAARAKRSAMLAWGSGVVAVLAGGVFLVATVRQQAHWRDSETLFVHALQVTSNNPIAHVNLGVALEKQGRLTEARTQYEAALQLDPNRVQVQNNLANMLDQAGETEAALAHYEAALRLKPNAPLAHINLGTTLVKLNRFAEARQHYEIAQQLAPQDPRPAYLLGKAGLRQGNSPEAVTQFEQALRLDPDHLQTLVWLARTRAADPEAQVRNGAKAVALAEHAAELTGGNDPFVLDTLAMAYAEAGQFTAAQQTIQRALELLTAAGDTNTAELRARQSGYQSGQPYREAFQSRPEAKSIKP